MPDIPQVPISKEPPAEAPDLQLLKRQLYAREEPTDFLERTKQLSNLPARKAEAFAKREEDTSPTVFADILNERVKRRRRLIKIAIMAVSLVVVSAVATTATLWYRFVHQLKKEQITIAIVAPAEFTSGGEITYQINYTNASKVAWQNVELAFEVPPGFHYETAVPSGQAEGQNYLFHLPDVAAGASAQAVIKGRLIGQLNANALAKAQLSVSPQNAPKSQFTNGATVTTTIRSVPVDVAVEGSNSASQGERLLAIIHVRNVSQENLAGMYLAINAPPGLQLSVEDPEFSPDFSAPDSQWQLPMLKPLDEVTRKLVFYVDGQANEQRSLTVQVGVQQDKDKIVQREISQVVTITTSALNVQQLFDDQPGDQIVQAGQAIKGEVQYRNTGTTGLRNVVVKVAFQGEGLDPAGLKLQNGAYDPITHSITWTSATVPELAFVGPNQGGKVNYNFAILPTDKFPLNTEHGSDNTLVTVASVDSADIATPLGQDKKIVSDRSTLAVATQVTLDATAFYDDGRLGLASSGPLPPKVGETTTYTVRFRLGSTFNDVSDAELMAVLPDGVKYTGKTYQTTGTVDFNDRTGAIHWKVPILSALTGRTVPAHELHVQVSITPGENARDQVIPFLNAVEAHGKDVFVSKTVSQKLDKFPDTATANNEKGKVE